MNSNLDLVRAGYDKIAATYTQERNQDSPDVALLDELIARLPQDARILDAGCGGGVPIAKRLCQVGRVTGIDFSESQLALARQNVPGAEFITADLTTLDMPSESFDAIVSYYAIIHIPRAHHAALIRNFYRMLKPNGHLLVCLGANDLADDHAADYLGAPMYWSHFDAPTNLHLVASSGFQILWSCIIADASAPQAGHLFVLASKPAQ